MNEYKKARTLTGLTLEKTSRITKVPANTICSWETGIRKPPEYVKRWYLKELEEIALNSSSKEKDLSK